MDLRDQFAVQFAAALAGALTDPAQIARRSYDFAEAMLEERARRIEADETYAIAEALPFGALEIDPDDLEEPYDPTWDIEPRWAVDAAPDTTRATIFDVHSVRPGLVRTQPSEVEANTPKIASSGT